MGLNIMHELYACPHNFSVVSAITAMESAIWCLWPRSVFAIVFIASF